MFLFFFFLLPRTITLRNRFHHRTRLHRTDSPSQQGVLERNADGVKPEGDTEVEKTAARQRCTHRAGEDSVTQPTGKQEELWRLGRSALVKKLSPLSSEEERTSGKQRERKRERFLFFCLICTKTRRQKKFVLPLVRTSLFPLRLVSFLSSQSFACLVAGHSKNTCLFCFVADIAFLA